MGTVNFVSWDDLGDDCRHRALTEGGSLVAVEGKQLRAAWFGLMTGAWVNWHYEKANEKT